MFIGDMFHYPPGKYVGLYGSQNMTPVYTGPVLGENKGELTSLNGEELKNFLLNEALFPESYIEKNRTFLTFLAFQELPFTIDSMIQYIEHKGLKKQHLSPATVRNRKYQMKRICRELVLSNPEKWSAVDEFKLEAFWARLKTGSRQTRAVEVGKILSKEEVSRLLKNCSDEWRLILLFLASTGVRATELVSIIKPRCVVKRGEVHITVIGKGNKQRTVICSKSLYESICRTFHSKYYLFCTGKGTQFDRRHIWRGCNRLGQQILRRKVGVHTFRHSFATHMIENGVELKRVSDFMGHSDSTITLDMYVHHDAVSLKDLPSYE